MTINFKILCVKLNLHLYCSYQEGPSTAELDSVNNRRTLEDSVVLSPNALKALLTECLSSWVNYLQVSVMQFNNKAFGFVLTGKINEPLYVCRRIINLLW